jgi:hypothetical protein
MDDAVVAYSKLETGFDLKEIAGHCLVLVVDRDSKYFGKIGSLVNRLTREENEVYLVEFMKGKRRIREEFNFRGRWKEGGEDPEKKLYLSRNPYGLLKEKENLFKLFRD